jgi:hypothetical protein
MKRFSIDFQLLSRPNALLVGVETQLWINNTTDMMIFIFLAKFPENVT